MEGILVNQHLGEAQHFGIWQETPEGFRQIEQRQAPPTGGGLRRWLSLARLLDDCRAVLTSGIGETPNEILKKSGLKTITMGGFIEEGLKAVYHGKPLTGLKSRRTPCTKGSCLGSGSGCL